MSFFHLLDLFPWHISGLGMYISSGVWKQALTEAELLTDEKKNPTQNNKPLLFWTGWNYVSNWCESLLNWSARRDRVAHMPQINFPASLNFHSSHNPISLWTRRPNCVVSEFFLFCFFWSFGVLQSKNKNEMYLIFSSHLFSTQDYLIIKRLQAEVPFFMVFCILWVIRNSALMLFFCFLTSNTYFKTENGTDR